jgi:hypothetical protein
MIYTSIQRLSTLSKICHLKILEEIQISVLIHIINLLPDVLNIQIQSISVDLTKDLLANQCSIEKRRNSIKTVYIEDINDMQHVDFLFTLCTFIMNFKVKHIVDMNIPLFLREFLKIVDDSGVAV